MLKKTQAEIREERRKEVMKFRYGLTEDDFYNLRVLQKDLCAICGKRAEGKRPVLFVDHCHNTRKIRGLLCGSCNAGLGYFKDNPKLLSSAAEYLQIDRSNRPAQCRERKAK